jgi:phage terminase large subunit
MALNYTGIQILIIRRTLKDLRKNHELPLMAELKDIAKYNAQNKEFHFPNSAMIFLGYCDSEADVLQYQGQNYDVIFVEEATQFTEFQLDCLTECNRRSPTMEGAFTSRMYYTCNPGGPSHSRIKRLFIDKDYKSTENPDDYEFIPSKVYDNDYIMKNDPNYVKTLENLPEMRRRAMLDGDWDAFEGQYFPEWNRDIHVIQPFEIPRNWVKFRSLDYGMDMTACYWWAVDTRGNCFVYRELHEPGLILSAAAKRIIDLTPKNELIDYTVASPDLWNKRQETGESGFEIMTNAGLGGLRRAKNGRIAGWRVMREYLKPITDEFGKPSARLRFFPNCKNAIKNIPQLQYDEKVLEDVAGEPHEITHAPESIRYGAISRPPITPDGQLDFPEDMPEVEKERAIINIQFDEKYQEIKKYRLKRR